jgi:hypothetical protein
MSKFNSKENQYHSFLDVEVFGDTTERLNKRLLVVT